MKAADAGCAADQAVKLCAENAWREGIRPGGVVSRMLAATEDIWENYHRHPFVAKAKDPDVMRIFANYVRQIMSGEMDIHRGYMKRLGISLEDAERTVPSLDNLSYTSYMIRIAYDDGAAEVAAAILSCALSYEAIAERIVAEHPGTPARPGAADHPFYGEWVQGYASPGYHSANLELIDLTERLAEGLSEPQLQHLVDVFVNCSRYELLFWDMAWEMRL